MKSNLILVLTLVITACGGEAEERVEQAPEPTTEQQSTPNEEVDIDEPETVYDSAFAASVGADDYGMSSYVMAFLKAGPNRSQDSTESAELQAAHLANIGRLAEEGKLAVAGPFLDNGELRGIYIFNVSSVEEARELTATDPAIQAGSLVMELHPWYGSASLKMVSEWHDKAAKIKF